jgi:hypothetical protein
MFPEAEMLPHQICSQPMFIGGATNYEADQQWGVTSWWQRYPFEQESTFVIFSEYNRCIASPTARKEVLA